MGILLGLVAGSLICNYIIYFSTVFGSGHLFCSWDMMWIENLNPIFETLKRLTGLYVLIYIFTGKHHIKILKSKLSKTQNSDNNSLSLKTQVSTLTQVGCENLN